jgi:DNA mismatch repair protein MSH2
MATAAKIDAPDMGLDAKSGAAFARWYSNEFGDADAAAAAAAGGGGGGSAVAARAVPVRFFSRQGCVTVHGDAALRLARSLYRTTAVVRFLGASSSNKTSSPAAAAADAAATATPATTTAGLPSLALAKPLFEQALRQLLLGAGLDAAAGGADDPAASADQGAGGGGALGAGGLPGAAAAPGCAVELYEGFGTSWTLSRAASPSRLAAFEEELFRAEVGGAAGAAAGGAAAAAAAAAMGASTGVDAPVVAAAVVALREGQRVVGVAVLEPSARRLSACEFVDDDNFCGLEAVLVQAGAREVVLPAAAGSGGGGGRGGGGRGGGGGNATAPMEADDPAAASATNAAAAAAAEARRLRDAVERAGALASWRPRALFSTRNLEADVARLTKQPQQQGGGAGAAAGGAAAAERHRDLLDLPQASAALAGLVAFCEAASDASLLGKAEIALHDPGTYMRLDTAALQALNVFPQRGFGPAAATSGSAGGAGAASAAASASSLYGLLCRCRTAMGKRRLRAWLKQPLVDPSQIRARHDAVEALAADAQLREAVRDALRGLPDVDALARKLEARRATLAELCQLYRASSTLPRLEQAVREYCEQQGGAGAAAPANPTTADGRKQARIRALLLERFADPLAAVHDADHLEKFEMLLEASVDLERVPDEYVISAAYDPRLGKLREERQQVENDVAAAASAAARDLGLSLDKTIKLEWHRAANTRTRCLRITQKEERAVRSKLQPPRYSVIETRKDGTKFTSPALRSAAERLTQASGRYEELQRGLVAQVVAVAATFVGVWERAAGVLAELDVLASFAEVAVCDPTRPFVRPEIIGAEEEEEVGGEAAAAMEGVEGAAAEAGRVGEGGPARPRGRNDALVLLGARHPCVEAQEGVEFVANDAVLERGASWFTLVTGPNMGGKSTFIRMVGACVLLAQAGSFVPCASARLAPRDAIFCRVGAGDCQQRGVSTFMAEMLETAAILRGATPESLVIVDELGRGTSTYDGFGLAWAISEHLMHRNRSAVLFATHFHELTDLSGPGGVRNLHVEAKVDGRTGRLAMLYRIREGACDQSFGVHVAESAHFPREVVESARRRLRELEGGGGGGAGGGGGGGAEEEGGRATGSGGGGGRGARAAAMADDLARGARGGGGEAADQQQQKEGAGGGGAEEAKARQRARRFLRELVSALPAEGEEEAGGEAAAAEAAARLVAQLEEEAREDPALRALLVEAGTA